MKICMRLLTPPTCVQFFRSIGHVLRKSTNNITRVSLKWTPEGKRKRGRPKTTWRRTAESEMKEMGQTWSELDRMAKDREQWRKLVLALCASGRNKNQVDMQEAGKCVSMAKAVIPETLLLKAYTSIQTLATKQSWQDILVIKNRSSKNDEGIDYIME